MITKIMRQVVILSLCCLALAFGIPVAQAQEAVSVSPILLDLEVATRDIVKKEVTVTNNTLSKQVVYATVNEISVDTAGEIKEFVSPAMTDRTDTITSWVEVTRGRIELEAGESKTIPLTIRVHPFAKSGAYHAFVGFVPEAKRHLAEARALQGDAEGVIIKVALAETENELLRIAGFFIDRFIVDETKREVAIELENTGDAPTTPQGEMIIYDSRGQEVAAVAVNQEATSLAPGEKKTIYSQVPFSDKIGRFKANLTLTYGANQSAAVFDTTQFFMVPPYLIVVLVIVVLLLSLLITVLLRRVLKERSEEDEDGKEVLLYVRNDREHINKDHDITIQKNS